MQTALLPIGEAPVKTGEKNAEPASYLRSGCISGGLPLGDADVSNTPIECATPD